MPGQNDLGPFGTGVQETNTEPSDFGDSGGGVYSWFKDCSGPTSDDGTRFTAQWANRLLKYIREACDGMGIARNEVNGSRLLQAIQKAIRPAANLGSGGDGVGVYKETDAGTLTHMLRRLKGSGGIAVTESGANSILIDGSAITGAGLALFYPQTETSDYKLTITIGSGKVTVDTGKTFIHRGCRRIATSDYLVAAREFNTSANKTYHLRWKWNNGSPAFYLYDLSNAGYNVSASPETHSKFDSDYDDMLIARVTTNGSNGITVTALANRHTLRDVQNNIGTTDSGSTSNSSGRANITGALNWARTPDILPSWSRWSVAPGGATDGNGQFTSGDTHDHDMNVIINAATRYGWDLTIQRDYAWDLNMRVLSLA